MKSRFHYITIQLQPDDDSKVPDGFATSSVFFKVGFNLNASRVVGPLEEKIVKSKNLGSIWHDIKPNRGSYSFELATELPYYLPNLEGKAEYILEFSGEKCVVSNRMVRAYWGKGVPEENGAAYVLLHRRALSSLMHDPKYANLHPLPMKTFMCCKFVSKLGTAEEAVECSFISWRNSLLERVHEVTDAFRSIEPNKTKYLFPYPAVASYPVFWLAVVGENDKIGCEQFTGDVRTVAWRALENLESEPTLKLLRTLQASDKKASYQSGNGVALAFLHYGHYEQALIQICTACESLLALALKKFLAKRQLSVAQTERALDDVSFSQLLNLHLFSICDITKLNRYKELVGQANWARQRRNEIVHLGKSEQKLSEDNVKAAIEAIQEIMDFVTSRVMNASNEDTKS